MKILKNEEYYRLTRIRDKFNDELKDIMLEVERQLVIKYAKFERRRINEFYDYKKGKDEYINELLKQIDLLSIK